MQRNCDSCGRPYDAKRPSSKFCGDTCKKRAQRAPKTESPAGQEGRTFAATLAALEAAGRAETFHGGVALTLAERVDATPGSGAAALARELRATMDEALKGAAVAADDVDDLKARRDRKLAAG